MRLLILALFLVLHPGAFAKNDESDERKWDNEKSVILSTGEQQFTNSKENCAKNDTCDLKEIIFRKEDYVIPANPLYPNDLTIYSTRMFLGYETDTVAAIR